MQPRCSCVSLRAYSLAALSRVHGPAILLGPASVALEPGSSPAIANLPYRVAVVLVGAD